MSNQWANSKHAHGLENPYTKCGGFGMRAYPSTSIWVGGIKGHPNRTMTND